MPLFQFNNVKHVGSMPAQEPQYRFFQKDGTVRVRRSGLSYLRSHSWYNAMVEMPSWKLRLTLISLYVAWNLLFATVYYVIGTEFILGTQGHSNVQQFLDAFFFSAQTFTTVGYGHISPAGTLTNAVAALEAFVGLLSFAMVSGIFYARFARPRPFLRFSDIALLSPHGDAKAFVLRVVPYKDHYLVEAEIRMNLVVRNQDGHNEFHLLDVEVQRIDALVLNWTIIHLIRPGSPLFGKSLEDLKAAKAEIFVFLKAHDEVYANPVVARTSYTAAEIVDNARFRRMYHTSENGTETVLHLEMLNQYDIVRSE